MKNIIYLDGLWELRLDPEKTGVENAFFSEDFEKNGQHDTIMLPSVIMQPDPNNSDNKKPFEGFAWFQRKVFINKQTDKVVKLFLERTRKTIIWINGVQTGDMIDTPNTPHVHDIESRLVNGENIITIMVDNTYSPLASCKPELPYLNGITGEISLRTYDNCYADNVKVFPDVENKSVKVRFRLSGTDRIHLTARAVCGGDFCREQKFDVCADQNGWAEFTYILSDNIYLWSEYTPYCYRMDIELANGDRSSAVFGMRDFQSEKNGFTVNGTPVFLRGKQDSLMFPSGAAPTDPEEWMDIFAVMKEYGINHYHFDGFCPPDAAFTAADSSGVYMEPELPFADCLKSENPDDWDYLTEEGKRILDRFGNHPSFCLMSLGNCYRGNRSDIEEKLKLYKDYDNRHIYTSDCRACCISAELCGQETENESCPNLKALTENPIILRNTGMFPFYPEYNEAQVYSMAAVNSVIREKQIAKGLNERWYKFYRSLGRFSMDCCRYEIEAVMRSERLAGFQLSDVRDRSELTGSDSIRGFMEKSGFISPEKWRGFCSDKVLLAEFDSCVIHENRFTAEISTRCCIPGGFTDDYIRWEIASERGVLRGGELHAQEKGMGLLKIGVIDTDIPMTSAPEKMVLTLTARETENSYDLWAFPETDLGSKPDGLLITDDTREAMEGLVNGSPVLLISDRLKNGIRGVCVNSIPCPAKPDEYGDLTRGFLIGNTHKALSAFPSAFYPTPQWGALISDCLCAVLDDTPAEFCPIIEVIDNRIRSHKLGVLFEAKVAGGRLMVCTIPMERLTETTQGKWFLKSVADYCAGESFRPSITLQKSLIKQLFL